MYIKNVSWRHVDFITLCMYGKHACISLQALTEISSSCFKDTECNYLQE